MMVESRPRPEPATSKGRQTRDRIVAVAAELIYQRGEADVGIRDVKQAAGISGSQMTHDVPDRHALIRAVIARRAREVIDFLSQPEIEGLDSLAKLRAWARMTVERQQGERHSGRLRARFAGRPVLRARRGRAHGDRPRASTPGSAAWPTGCAGSRRRGRSVPGRDPGELATGLIAALQGGYTLRRPAPSRRWRPPSR
jgi:TetR/AcrR family transcriptional regulator, transcriptional repressor for nem operon